MSVHHLLPWYVNGTLEEAERSGFQGHLPDCAACRAEIDLVRELRARIDAEPELLSDHPAPEVILAAVDAGSADVDLADGQAESVRRHLAVCDACTRESGWLQGKAVAAPSAAPAPAREEAAVVALPPPAARPRWVAWGGLAAALVVVALLIPFLRTAPPAPVTGLATTTVVRSVTRGQEPAVVRVAAGVSQVQLLFEVDLGGADYPARLEVSRTDGASIFAGAISGPDDLLQGLFVPFTCARTDCPDGELVALVTPASSRPPTAFRFRVETAGDDQSGAPR